MSLAHTALHTSPTRQRGDRRCHALAAASVPRWRVGLVWPLPFDPVVLSEKCRFSSSADGKQMIGHTGQSSTQVVILTNPPESYAVIPLGESDHKESPHFDDQ